MGPLFINNAGELLVHPAGYLLLRCRAGVVEQPVLAELLTRMGRLLVRNRWQYLLSDCRELPELPVACQRWIMQNWVGSNIERPALLHVAVLPPVSLAARRMAFRLLTSPNSGVRHYPFPDEAAAHAFIIGNQA